MPDGSHVIGLLCSGIRDHRDRTVGERGPGRYGWSRSTGNSGGRCAWPIVPCSSERIAYGRGSCYSPQISSEASPQTDEGVRLPEEGCVGSGRVGAG